MTTAELVSNRLAVMSCIRRGIVKVDRQPRRRVSKKDKADLALAERARLAGDRRLYKKYTNRVSSRRWRFEQPDHARRYHRRYMRKWRKKRNGL